MARITIKTKKEETRAVATTEVSEAMSLTHFVLDY